MNMVRRDTKQDESADTTRQRIMEAASEVFAEHGFAHATVRDIVDRAGANIAAVNYHFGGKNELYAAVLHKLMAERAMAHPYDADLPHDATPRQRLHTFVRAFLRRLMLEEPGFPLGRMMTREMIEPTRALDELVRDIMAPSVGYLIQLAEQIVGRTLDPRERFHVVSSVVGQVVFHKHCRPVLDRLFPQQSRSSDEVDRLAEHIANFSYIGIEQMRRAHGEQA